MRIALIGSRGIPARYSGFETFYEQLAVLQELVDDVGRVRELRRLSRRRVETFYNWEWVTQFYEELFVRMGRGEACPSYDAWLAQRNLATATTE